MPSARPESGQPASVAVVDRNAPQPDAEPAPPTVGGRQRALRVVAAPALLAFAAYLTYALFVTWPWVLDPGGTLYSVIGGDLSSSVATYEQLAEEWQAPFLPGEITQVNAPEGISITWALNLAALGSSATLWLLSLAVGSVAAHGIVAVLGYTLSAFAMFLLARWVTGQAGAAFAVGLAFGFWPYTFGTGYTWPHYIHLWVLVLLVWRLLVVAELPTRRNALLAGAAAALALTWIAYNLLIAGVVYATLAALAVARSALNRTVRPQLVAQSTVGAIVLLVLAVVFIAGRASGYAGVPVRSAGDSVANSARPAMYVVPGPRHPLLGARTEPWLYDHFAATDPNPPPGKAIYADIYLGVSLLLAALGGAVWVLVMVGRRRLRPSLDSRPTWAGICALVLGAVAFAFSAPPKVSVAGVLIPMPYAVVEQVTNVFRVAHRFSVVVMLAACLLAALGLAALLRRRSPALQIAVVAAVAAVFAIDLSAMPSPRTTALTHPSIYRLLDRQPQGTVAEYPLNIAPAVESRESLHQDVHGHRLFMGAPLGTPAESRKLELRYLLAERTVPDLAAYGVDYVVVHHPEPASLQPDQSTLGSLQPGQPVRGLRFIGGDAEGSLYRVLARRSRFTSYGIRGFHATEGAAPGMRWVGENGAELELRGRCRPCVGAVTFPAASFAEPRTLTIRDERGRTIFSGRVGNGGLVRFPVEFSGRSVIRLSTNPPPKQISSVIGGADSRTVGLSLGQPVRFLPDRDRHRWLP